MPLKSIFCLRSFKTTMILLTSNVDALAESQIQWELQSTSIFRFKLPSTSIFPLILPSYFRSCAFVICWQRWLLSKVHQAPMWIVCLFVCLFVCLLVCLLVCLFVYIVCLLVYFFPRCTKRQCYYVNCLFVKHHSWATSSTRTQLHINVRSRDAKCTAFHWT